MMHNLLLVVALAGAPGSSPVNFFHGCYGAHGMGQVQHATATIKNGDIVVAGYQLEYRPETVKKTKRVKDEDGGFRDVEYTMTVMKVMARNQQQKFKADKVQAFDHEGKKIGLKTLNTMLEDATPVLVSHQGQPIDPGYFTILKKGAVALVLPKVNPKDMPVPKGPAVVSEVSYGDKDDNEPAPTTKGPKGPAPSLASASIDDKGVLFLQESNSSNDVNTFYVEEEEDGVITKVAVKVRTSHFSMDKKSMDAKFVKANGMNGKAIGAKALAGQLRKTTTVLLSTDGKKVDPYYLQLFKEGTLVLVPPMMGHGHGYGATVAGESPSGHDPDAKAPLPAPKKLPPPPIEKTGPKAKFPPPPQLEPPKTSKLSPGLPPMLSVVARVENDTVLYAVTEVHLVPADDGPSAVPGPQV